MAADPVGAVGVALVGGLVVLQGGLPRVRAAQNLHQILPHGQSQTEHKEESLCCCVRMMPVHD